MSTEASSKAAAGGARSRGDDLQCRGRGGDRAEEMRGAAAKQDGGVPPVVGDDAGVVVVEPCVIAVDDSSVDRAVVTALLRRSNYRGQARRVQFAFSSVLHLYCMTRARTKFTAGFH